MTMTQSILKNSIGLGLFAIFTAGVIAFAQLNTADSIKENIARAEAKILLELIPASEHDNDLLNDKHSFQNGTLLGQESEFAVYIARKNQQFVGAILPVTAPDGYTGPIKMLVAINRNNSVLGARVIQHQETPGLGDKIEIRKSDWITAFDGKNLQNPQPSQWKVVKDGGEFDQLTGATITPRAVVKAIKQSLIYFTENKETILRQSMADSVTDATSEASYGN